MIADVRDENYTHVNADETVYDCSDDGYVCELTDIDGLTTCTECGDRPHVRNGDES
jgi:hypothetical protein